MQQTPETEKLNLSSIPLSNAAFLIAHFRSRAGVRAAMDKIVISRANARDYAAAIDGVLPGGSDLQLLEEVACSAHDFLALAVKSDLRHIYPDDENLRSIMLKAADRMFEIAILMRAARP